jgi:hypothetical protein
MIMVFSSSSSNYEPLAVVVGALLSPGGIK